MIYLKDLILTDNFLIKGHINTGGQRLSTFLNNIPKSFVEIDEVSLLHLGQGERIEAPQLLVRVEEIILAHEIEVAGDEGLRILANQERDEITVTFRFSGLSPIHLSGKVSKRAVERDTSGHHDFIVVVEPRLQGLTDKAAREYAVLDDLPYVIANRNRVAIIGRPAHEPCG